MYSKHYKLCLMSRKCLINNCAQQCNQEKLLKPLNILISPLGLKPLFLQEFSAVGDFSPLESHCSSQSIVMKYNIFHRAHYRNNNNFSSIYCFKLFNPFSVSTHKIGLEVCFHSAFFKKYVSLYSKKPLQKRPQCRPGIKWQLRGFENSVPIMFTCMS